MNARRSVRLFLRYPRGFLVLTSGGFEFVKGWFRTNEHIPPHAAKLYQLLLRTVSMGGVISHQLALKVGYNREIVEEAISHGYVELTRVPKKPRKETLKRIRGMVGEPPKEIYV